MGSSGQSRHRYSHPKITEATFPFGNYGKANSKKLDLISAVLRNSGGKTTTYHIDENFKIRVDLLCGLGVVHGTYVRVTGVSSCYVKRLVAYSLNQSDGSSTVKCVLERTSQHGLVTDMLNLKPNRHTMLWRAYDIHRMINVQIPEARVIHVSFHSGSLHRRSTMSALLHLLALKVRTLRYVRFGQPIWTCKMEDKNIFTIPCFRISRVEGMHCEKVTEDIDFLVSVKNTKYVVHITKAPLGLPCPAEVCCRHGLSRNKSDMDGLPFRKLSAISLRQREIAKLSQCHGLRTAAVSYHELELCGNALKRYLLVDASTRKNYEFGQTQLLFIVFGVADPIKAVERFKNIVIQQSSACGSIASFDLADVCSPLGARLTDVLQKQFEHLYRRTRVVYALVSGSEGELNIPVFSLNMEHFVTRQMNVVSTAHSYHGKRATIGLSIDLRRKFYCALAKSLQLQICYTCSKDGHDLLSSASLTRVKYCWADIGGHIHIKQILLDLLHFSMKYHHLFDHVTAPKKNVLLFGPPGTGKTLVAKILAEESGMSFLNVKGPELLNMYVGQSERAIRSIFRKAKENQPSLLFFDEVESIASKRSSGHVATARMVSQLILEFDAIGSNRSIFIIGASNRPDILDTSLLRPGRFDRLLYMGIDTTLERRIKLLEASTRQMCLSNDVQLHEIAKHCDPLCSGADIYGICVRAWMLAAKRYLLASESRMLIQSSYQPVCVSNVELIASAVSTTTSVVSEDMPKYEELRDRYDSTD